MAKEVLNNTVRTDKIFAIVGRWDLQYEFDNHKADIIKQLPKDLAYINIYEPNSNPIKHYNHFADVLQISFYDVEEKWTDTIKPLTDKQGKTIYDFIMKNKDKKFLINCEAGISRSAGVGLAIEYLFRDKFIYPEWKHFPSKILQHQRYMPNMEVFNKIIKWDN